MTPNLPSIPLLKRVIAIDVDGSLVWSATRRKATVRGLFGTPPQIVIGWLSVDEDHARHALEHGQWPDDIGDRKEPHLRRGDWAMAWTMLDRNLERLEANASYEVVAIA